MSNINTKTGKGFTIVELLIVIVIISILATITVVAFNGIQIRARHAKLSADVTTIKKAMEFYKAEKGVYPSCNTGGNCWSDEILPQLSPKYVSSIKLVNFGYAFYSSMPDVWAMEYAAGDEPYKIPETCKFGVNVPPAWFSNAPLCK